MNGTEEDQIFRPLTGDIFSFLVVTRVFPALLNAALSSVSSSPPMTFSG